MADAATADLGRNLVAAVTDQSCQRPYWPALALSRLQASGCAFEPGDGTRLVMDEFALHKGHRYATVIMDAERKRVFWVGKGNSRETSLSNKFLRILMHCYAQQLFEMPKMKFLSVGMH